MTTKLGSEMKCSSERHLWRLGGLTLAVYNKIGELANREIDGTYPVCSTSVEKLSEFFGSHYQPTWRSVKLLTQMGFLIQLLPSKQRKAVGYCYVSHKEWAKKHPGECRHEGLRK